MTSEPINTNASEDTDVANDVEEAQSSLPTADFMLARLHNIDLSYFDINARADELKGTNAWIFILTAPISAILLVLLTLLGSFLTGYFIISFIVSAGIVYSFAKIVDTYEQGYLRQARVVMMKRIEEIEGELGLLYHFKEFLPTKYRHLWQSVRHKNFQYIEQYIYAIRLLQAKLDKDKFTKLWHLKYPLTDPEYVEAKLIEEAKKKSK